jgi:hypothetical protein
MRVLPDLDRLEEALAVRADNVGGRTVQQELFGALEAAEVRVLEHARRAIHVIAAAPELLGERVARIVVREREEHVELGRKHDRLDVGGELLMPLGQLLETLPALALREFADGIGAGDFGLRFGRFCFLTENDCGGCQRQRDGERSKDHGFYLV